MDEPNVNELSPLRSDLVRNVNTEPFSNLQLIPLLLAQFHIGVYHFRFDESLPRAILHLAVSTFIYLKIRFSVRRYNIQMCISIRMAMDKVMA